MHNGALAPTLATFELDEYVYGALQAGLADRHRSGDLAGQARTVRLVGNDALSFEWPVTRGGL